MNSTWTVVPSASEVVPPPIPQNLHVQFGQCQSPGGSIYNEKKDVNAPRQCADYLTGVLSMQVQNLQFLIKPHHVLCPTVLYQKIHPTTYKLINYSTIHHWIKLVRDLDCIVHHWIFIVRLRSRSDKRVTV